MTFACVKSILYSLKEARFHPVKQEKIMTENNKSSGRDVLSTFWQFTKGLKKYYLAAILTTFAGILFSFLTPQVIRLTVDSVIGEEAPRLPAFFLNIWNGLGGREALRENLLLCAGAILVFTVAEGVFTLSSRLLMSKCTESYIKRVRDRIFRHIQHLPFSWHTQNRTGDIIQRCTSDMDVIRNFVANQLLEVIRIVMLAVTALYLMSTMNMELTIVAFLFLPLTACYSGIFFSMLSKRFRKADEAESDLMVAVQENLTGVRVVRAFGSERRELKKFDKFSDRFYDLWVNMGYIMGVYWGVGDLVSGVQVLTIMILGAFMAYEGTITLGEFLVFVSYNRTLSFPLRRLGRILSDMSKMRVSAERLSEILHAGEEVDPPEALKPEIKGDISFKNVSFAYGDNAVLKNVSFDIKAGSTFGILGNTGSGKSTLSYLVDRLYDLEEGQGEIMVDGVDIKDIERDHLRKNVGLVLQEPFLFSKTIKENIAIARPDASFDEVRKAAATADVDESITGFAQGYDTIVGERGVTLSGGQKQRVAIARTLMCGCPIIVFDDSLSAVDLTTDAKIRAALKAETAGATVILISHRINTLMDCDMIMTLENGEVAEIGTHEELIKTGGVYARTYQLQSAAAERGEGRE